MSVSAVWRGVLAVLLPLVFSATASASSIVLIGYWPPTNDMLRQFSTDSTQNPDGWAGQNWQGLGHDVYSFFPEFPPDNMPFNDPFGSDGWVGSADSDFRVDYQDTSADFWTVMDALKPVALITFSFGDFDNRWEIERVEGGHFGGSTPEFDWITDANGITQPTQDSIDPRSWDAISTYRDGNRLQTQLPVDNILAATAALGLANVFVDETGTSGEYLSGFLALHGLYYNSLHNDPNDPFRNIAAGHIHVGSSLSVADAKLLSEVTLTQVLNHVNSVQSPQPVPEPGTLLLLAAGLAIAGRRLRRGALVARGSARQGAARGVDRG